MEWCEETVITHGDYTRQTEILKYQMRSTHNNSLATESSVLKKSHKDTHQYL